MAAIQVDRDLISYGDMVRSSADMQATARSQLVAARNQLVNLATQYADTIQEVEGYQRADSFESTDQDRLRKYKTECDAALVSIEADLTALGIPFT